MREAAGAPWRCCVMGSHKENLALWMLELTHIAPSQQPGCSDAGRCGSWSLNVQLMARPIQGPGGLESRTQQAGTVASTLLVTAPHPHWAGMRRLP